MASNLDDIASLSVVGGLSEEEFLKINDMGAGVPIREGEVYYLEKKKARIKRAFFIGI